MEYRPAGALVLGTTGGALDLVGGGRPEPVRAGPGAKGAAVSSMVTVRPRRCATSRTFCGRWADSLARQAAMVASHSAGIRAPETSQGCRPSPIDARILVFTCNIPLPV